jgi:hypothetical protein
VTDKPFIPSKPWVPDLMFDAPKKPAATTPGALEFPSFDAKPTPAPVAPEAAPEVAAPEEGTTKLADAAPAAAPAVAAPAETIDDLQLSLTAQEKSLRDLRISQRNLQDTLAKAKHTAMFGERSKQAAAKDQAETLAADYQRGEAEERRLVTETQTLRVRIERLRR